MKARLRRRYCGALCVLASACASGPHGRPDFLKVLDEQGATESEVTAALGQPFARYDGDRVLAYRLNADKHGYYIAERKDGWTGVKYDLVLEFDNGALARHRLIETRPDNHASGTATPR